MDPLTLALGAIALLGVTGSLAQQQQGPGPVRGDLKQLMLQTTSLEQAKATFRQISGTGVPVLSDPEVSQHILMLARRDNPVKYQEVMASRARRSGVPQIEQRPWLPQLHGPQPPQLEQVQGVYGYISPGAAQTWRLYGPGYLAQHPGQRVRSMWSGPGGCLFVETVGPRGGVTTTRIGPRGGVQQERYIPGRGVGYRRRATGLYGANDEDYGAEEEDVRIFSTDYRNL